MLKSRSQRVEANDQRHLCATLFHTHVPAEGRTVQREIFKLLPELIVIGEFMRTVHVL